jgi:hypothetical protein
MCFSAGASFTAGAVLTAVGTATIRKVKKPSHVVFSCITMFFALQQLTEGVLWLTLTHPGYSRLQAITTQMFVVMAQVIWPALIPVSVLLLEENKTRKKLLVALFLAGLYVALSTLYGLVRYPVHADISSRHLVYLNDSYPGFGKIGLAMYFTVTVIPLFVSGIRWMYVLGIIMGLSFAVSAVFYMKCLTSVWCFFAAVISFVIYFIAGDLSEPRKKIGRSRVVA